MENTPRYSENYYRLWRGLTPDQRELASTNLAKAAWVGTQQVGKSTSGVFYLYRQVIEDPREAVTCLASMETIGRAIHLLRQLATDLRISSNYLPSGHGSNEFQVELKGGGAIRFVPHGSPRWFGGYANGDSSGRLWVDDCELYPMHWASAESISRAQVILTGKSMPYQDSPQLWTSVASATTTQGMLVSNATIVTSTGAWPIQTHVSSSSSPPTVYRTWGGGTNGTQ